MASFLCHFIVDCPCLTEVEKENPGVPLGQAEQFLLTIHSIQGEYSVRLNIKGNVSLVRMEWKEYFL